MLSKNQFYNLQPGDWLEDCNGIYEVTDTYKEDVNNLVIKIETSEVYFNSEEDDGAYHLEGEYTEYYSDVKYCDLVFSSKKP